jgi:hypothetical protein
LERALAMPTAEVTEANIGEVAEAAIESQEVLDATMRFVRTVFEQDEEAGTLHALSLPELRGTNVYVRASCPGPDVLHPVLDFSHGQLRIDSPNFTQEFLDNYEVEGDLLLRFEACRISSFELGGSGRAHYDLDTRELALAPSFHAIDLSDTARRTTPFEDPMRAMEFEAFQVVVTLESQQTLVLEWITDENMVDLRGRNGVFACALDREILDLDCTAPP